jgi:hypothetical protein
MYSKADQLKSNRIKPKREPSFGKKKSFIKPKRIATDSEVAFLNWLHEDKQMDTFTCMACSKPVEHYHHVKEYSSDKKNHMRLIPLCNFHHLGGELSPHGTAKLWRSTYSMEFQIAEAKKLVNAYKISKVL